jgi:hypothetical protein
VLVPQIWQLAPGTVAAEHDATHAVLLVACSVAAVLIVIAMLT